MQAVSRVSALTRARPLVLQAARFHSARVSKASPTAHADPVTQPQLEYVPGGPILRGGPNDATPFPVPNRMHGSYHWSFERLVSAALIPLTASAAAVSGSAYPVVDGLLAITLIAHSHIGFDACLVDYVHPRKFRAIGTAAKWGLRLLTTGALVGVYSFNTNDIGLTELIKRVWTA